MALGLAAAAAAVAIWAGWIVLTRAGASVLTPADVALLRYGAPALLLAPVWLRRGLLPAGVARWRIAVMTLGWGAPFAFLAARGLRDADVGLFAALAPGAMPLWAAAIGLAAFGVRPGPRGAAGLALIAVGLAAALAAAPLASLAGAPWITAAAFGWAAYTHAFRGSGLGPVEATAIVGAWSTALTLPLALAFGGVGLHRLPWDVLVGQALLQGVVSGVVSAAAYALAIRELGASRAAASAALVPGLAAAMAWAALGEAPALGAWAALALTTAGALLLHAPPRRR